MTKNLKSGWFKANKIFGEILLTYFIDCMHLLTSTAVESSTQRPLFLEMNPATAVAGKAPDFKNSSFFQIHKRSLHTKKNFCWAKSKVLWYGKALLYSALTFNLRFGAFDSFKRASLDKGCEISEKIYEENKAGFWNIEDITGRGLCIELSAAGEYEVTNYVLFFFMLKTTSK